MENVHSRKKKIVIVAMVVIIAIAVSGLVINDKRIEAERAALALKSYVPYDYSDLIETYGEFGSEYELAMGRYTEANKCDYISETISDLQNLDTYLDLVYDGVPGVRVVAKNNDLLIGSNSVDYKMNDILKYSSIKGTTGEVAIQGLKKMAAMLDQKIVDGKLTRNDWFTLKTFLIGWHSPDIMDKSLQECVVSKIQDNGWQP